MCSDLPEEADLPPHRCAVERNLGRFLDSLLSIIAMVFVALDPMQVELGVQGSLHDSLRYGFSLLLFRDGSHVRSLCLLHFPYPLLSIHRPGSNHRAFGYTLSSQCINHVVMLIGLSAGITHMPSFNSSRSSAMRASGVAKPGLRQRPSSTTAIRYGGRSSCFGTDAADNILYFSP